jgi:hypothetical protein
MEAFDMSSSGFLSIFEKFSDKVGFTKCVFIYWIVSVAFLWSSWDGVLSSWGRLNKSVDLRTQDWVLLGLAFASTLASVYIIYVIAESAFTYVKKLLANKFERDSNLKKTESGRIRLEANFREVYPHLDYAEKDLLIWLKDNTSTKMSHRGLDTLIRKKYITECANLGEERVYKLNEAIRQFLSDVAGEERLHDIDCFKQSSCYGDIVKYLTKDTDDLKITFEDSNRFFFRDGYGQNSRSSRIGEWGFDLMGQSASYKLDEDIKKVIEEDTGKEIAVTFEIKMNYD